MRSGRTYTYMLMTEISDANSEGVEPTKIAVVFVCVALGFTLVYWYLVSRSYAGSLPFSMDSSIPGAILSAILRDFGPLLAAVLVSGSYQGRAGLRRLWRTVARWRISAWLYLLALFGPVAAAAGVAWIGVQTASMGRNPGAISALHFILVFFAMAVVDGPLGEEVGWRGLLLPRLLCRMGPVEASTAVGGVWWLWHVPLYLADGKMSTIGEWSMFLVDTLALSMIFTWFYLKSRSSTFLAIVLHNMLNFSVFLILHNIWHKVGTSMIPNLAHEAIVVIVGVAAASSLWRHSREAVPYKGIRI